MNQFPPGSSVSDEGNFEFLGKFEEILENKGQSTTPSINETNFKPGCFFHICLDTTGLQLLQDTPKECFFYQNNSLKV